MAFTCKAVAKLCFALAILFQLRCISSTSLRAAGSLGVRADSNDASVGGPISDFAGTQLVSQQLLEDDPRSQNFLEVSSAVDTSALMTRVDQVQNLAGSQEFALQAQQQALVGLQQEQQLLEARLAALAAPEAGEKAKSSAEASADEEEKADKRTEKLQSQQEKSSGSPEEKVSDDEGDDEGKTPTDEASAEAAEVAHFLCSPVTTHACSSYKGFGGDSGCSSYGKATCNADNKCICEEGICADGHGHCHKDPSRLLSGTYRIEVHKVLGSFIHMQPDQEGCKSLDFSQGPPGDAGTFHMVVNTDDSVMFYSKRWGPDHFMTVVKADETTGKLLLKDSMTNFASPLQASFEVYEDEKKLIYLKDIETGFWLDVSKKFGGNAILGRRDFPGESGAMIFHPPLKDLKMMKASAHCIWPLLPLLLLVASVFG